MATPVYKRPTVVRKACAGYSNSRAVSPYASGVVADICRKMHSSTPAPFRKPEWCPPLGHASYFAALKARGENTEQYERLTEEFYVKHPPKAPVAQVTQVVDQAPMLELNDRYYSRGQIPPVPVVTRAMRKAGYSEERVERYVKWNKRMEETYEERTAALEKIFAKWPSASKGPVKKKVIKAVKKNLT